MNNKNSRWIVLIASVLVSICIGGGYSWSVFIAPLAKVFGWSYTDLSMAYSINMGIAPIPLLVGSMLQKRFGEKRIIIFGGLIYCFGIFVSGFANSLQILYMTYGVIAGFGAMMALSAVLSNAVKFFPKKSGLALGMSLAGFSSSALLIAPGATTLITKYGVMQTFKILGIMMTVIVSLCSIFIKDTAVSTENGDLGDEDRVIKADAVKHSNDKNWRQMLADHRFYILIVLFACGIFAGVMTISSAAPIGQEMYHLPVTYAAVFVGIISVANGSGRIIGGSICDRFGSNNVFTGVYLITSLALLLLINSRSPVVFAASIIAIGFGYGSSMVATATMIKSYFGAQHYSANYAVTFIVYTIVAFIAPRIAATLKLLNNGDYSKSFLLAIFVTSSGFAVSLVYQGLYKGRYVRI